MSNLLEKSSILLTPLSYNSGSVLSIKPTSGAGDFEFRRPGSATRTTQDLLIETVTDNIPRIDYSGGVGHWLFEPESTNIIEYSSDLSAWNKLNSTVTQSNLLSLDGVNNSYLYESTATNSYIYKEVSLQNLTEYTLSFFVKSNTSTNVKADVWDTTQLEQCSIEVNLTTKVISNFIGTSYKIEDYSNNWLRISVTFNSENNFGTTFNRYFNVDSVGTELYIWGAQLQLGNMSSYIPTSGAATTRLAEVAINSGNSSLINSAQGVIYVEIAALNDDITQRRISISDGTQDNRIQIKYGNSSNRISVLVRSNGSTNFNKNTANYDILEYNKIAVSYNDSDYSFWVNGVKLETSFSGSTPTGLYKLDFNGVSALSEFFGKTKCVAIFKEALTDAELTCLTTI